MSRQMASRGLTLTEELERLEQQITLTLQEIDSNFSKAHRIVTSSILPIVEQYAKHSSEVWEGSKFWKQFFEASANVSLSGYEEAAFEEEVTNTETSTQVETPSGQDEDYTASNDIQRDETEDSEDFTIDSPTTQVTGKHTTPKLPPSTAKKANGNARALLASPSPRKYTGNNPKGATTPSTPGQKWTAGDDSSPFAPGSAYQPSTAQGKHNNDPLMHRVLDRNFRVQATPHSQRPKYGYTAHTQKSTTPATTTKRAPWDDSPQSSPETSAPQLRSEFFSPQKTAGKSKDSVTQRTPGVSVLTPAKHNAPSAALPMTSTGRQLFSPQDQARYTATNRTSHLFSTLDDSDSDNDIAYDMSPPKTMQFHVPQSRLLQTPAREASKKIVDDLLMTAGADATDDIEDDGMQWEEQSPSMIRSAQDEDDTF